MKRFRKSWGKFSKAVVLLILAAVVVVALVATAIPAGAGVPEDVKELQLASLNPDFEAYWDDPPEPSYGYIPPPIDLSHLDELSIQGAETLTLPSSFDWRDSGKVTPVKNQNPCGTCWDFGTTSVLESAVLIGESAAYNFSEQSVALCVDRSWVYLYDDSDDPCMGGGWSWLASEVFIRKGSVLETCNPYNPSALNCDGTCVCDSCPSIKYVDGYRLVTNDGSQISTIKNAVYNQGPMTVAYYHDFDYEYWDPTWGAVYDCYLCSESANHLISIIGWDDDVPHPNPSHPGTGAWIVKNSWGTAYPWAGGAGTYDGHFYLAYDSSCAEEVAYLKYKDYDPDEELLYWDEAGLIDAAGYGDNSAWMANVFTAAQDGNITHVDFWTTSSKADYEIYVWDGSFGSELGHQTGTCQELGYYSIPLSTPISVPAGHQFTVSVKMTTPGFSSPIPVEAKIPGTVDPPIQSNVSFVRHTSGDSWEDLADYGENACLRVRMSSEPTPDVSISKDVIGSDFEPGDPITFTLTIVNEGAEVASNVVVTDDLPTEVLAPSVDSTLTITPTGPFVWDVEPLSVGESGVITIYGQIDPSLPSDFSFVNTATISDPEDNTPGNNTSSVTIGESKVYLPLVARCWPLVAYLHPIDNPDGDGVYTVRWSWPSCAPSPSYYQLQGDDDPQFGSPSTFTEYDTTFEAYSPAAGTYYWRVRAYLSGTGWSEWSNVQSVTVGSFAHVWIDNDTGGNLTVEIVGVEKEDFSPGLHYWRSIPPGRYTYKAWAWCGSGTWTDDFPAGEVVRRFWCGYGAASTPAVLFGNRVAHGAPMIENLGAMR